MYELVPDKDDGEFLQAHYKQGYMKQGYDATEGEFFPLPEIVRSPGNS
jgi:hypothetical protein